jgi:hypothetical protein
MFTKKAIFMLLIVLCMGGTILAQPEGTIVFISRPDFTDPETGESPDMPHVYALQDSGYDVVIFYNDALSTASQETLDTLYNANLIIMGRSSPSPPYQTDKLIWNEIMTPILNLELWNCRNSRLNWFNTADMVSVADSDTVYNAIIEVPGDPVFDGLDTSSPVPWINAPFDAVGTTDAGNGIVLARLQSDATVLFVRFEPEVEFYNGSGDLPGGHRTVIGNGRDEGGAAPFNYYNFTPESEQVFMREVARLFVLGGGTVPSAVEDRENTAIPSNFVLFQNYPNPFNPTTTIAFDLPEKSRVRLSLINILGEEIMEIKNGEYGTGHHEIVFNADNLATGVYFYKIETERHTAVKKLVIVK